MNILKRYKKQQDRIMEFKEAFISYTSLQLKTNPTERDKELSLKLREKLNNLKGEVSGYVQKAKAPISITSIEGGRAQNIDVFSNLFSLSQFEISPQTVIDSLDSAFGNYNLYNKFFIQILINPLHWIGLIIRIPFFLARFAGFDQQKIEFSLVGKLYKFFGALIIYSAAILTSLSLLGFDTKISTCWRKNDDTKHILSQENKTKLPALPNNGSQAKPSR